MINSLGRALTRLGLWMMGLPYRRPVISAWDRTGRRFDILAPVWEHDPFLAACDIRADMAAGKSLLVPPGWRVRPAVEPDPAVRRPARSRTHTAAVEPADW